MHTCGPRGTSVDGVNSSCGCDPGLQQKEIRYVKTLTIVVLVRVFEQWRRDAFENPMRVTSLKSSCLNVFVGDSGDRPGTHFLRALTGATITFAMTRTAAKIAERSSPRSCDGVDYE